MLSHSLALLLFFFLLFFFAVRAWRRQRTLGAQLEAYRRGDYQGQLRAIEGLRSGNSEPPEYLFFRGKALYELGQLKEAEDCLRKGLPREPNRQRKALCEDALGEVLLEQKRYAEAIACFKSSIANWPQRGCCHRAIAAALLRQGTPAADALRWARTAVKVDEASHPATSEIHDLNLAEALATMAWAVAAYSGDAAEVDRLLERAFTLCPETTRPIRAQLHYHAGRAYSALGRTADSVSHFSRAASCDPTGNCGRLGRSAAEAVLR